MGNSYSETINRLKAQSYRCSSIDDYSPVYRYLVNAKYQSPEEMCKKVFLSDQIDFVPFMKLVSCYYIEDEDEDDEFRNAALKILNANKKMWPYIQEKVQTDYMLAYICEFIMDVAFKNRDHEMMSIMAHEIYGPYTLHGSLGINAAWDDGCKYLSGLDKWDTPKISDNYIKGLRIESVVELHETNKITGGQLIDYFIWCTGTIDAIVNRGVVIDFLTHKHKLRNLFNINKKESVKALLKLTRPRTYHIFFARLIDDVGYFGTKYIDELLSSKAQELDMYAIFVCTDSAIRCIYDFPDDVYERFVRSSIDGHKRLDELKIIALSLQRDIKWAQDVDWSKITVPIGCIIDRLLASRKTPDDYFAIHKFSDVSLQDVKGFAGAPNVVRRKKEVASRSAHSILEHFE